MSTHRARLAALAASASVVALIAAGQGATAAPGPTPNPKAQLLQHRVVTTVDKAPFRLRALDKTRTVKVLVQLDGASVVDLEEQAQAAGQQPTKASKARDRAAVRAAQEPAVAEIRARGGKVETRYVETVSGLAATVPASQIPAIEALPGVVSVDPVRIYARDNGRSNNYTGAAVAWTSYGTTGAGVKVAILDTGVDYGHADFGGPGTVAYYDSNDPTIIEPSHPFPTTKVVAGYDLVGDDYDASSDNPDQLVPHPDPDPLDCEGHGTHVAGTAAGLGVTSGGATYPGPYTQSDVNGANLTVPPGAAPGAAVMAYRIFGCDGSVDSSVIVDAINRAVADGANIINMSLGLAYGEATGVEQTAVTNAVKAGTTVVASAGNDGHVPYLVSGPSSTPAALSVAAADVVEKLNAAILTSGAVSLTLVNANDGTLPGGSVELAVLSDGSGGIGLGCDASDYAGTAGKLVVTLRGSCARVDRATFAQEANAAGVIMVNSSDGLPPYEGTIDDVTIPFLGALQSDAGALQALNGEDTTLAPTMLDNPGYRKPASFTSAGPRQSDAGVKPDVSAPGVSLLSAKSGSGNGGLVESGTSMASPHTAGIAALVRAANPAWSAQQVKNAIVNTATLDPAVLDPSLGQGVVGNGMVQPLQAMAAAVQLQATKDGDTGLTFGVRERDDLQAEARVRLINTSKKTVTVNLSATASDGATLEVRPSRVQLRKGQRDIEVKIRMSKSAVAGLPEASATSLPLVVGRVTASSSGLPTATMPVQVVQYARSEVEARLQGGKAGSAIEVRNRGIAAGVADVYEWLAEGKRDKKSAFDLRAVGLQTFIDVPGDRTMYIALAAYNQVSTAGQMEFDVWLDTSGDGTPDYLVAGADYGLLTAGTPDGTLGSMVIDLNTGDAVVYQAGALLDGSSVVLPLLASDIGLTGASPMVRVLQVDAYPIFNPGRTDSVVVNANVDVFSQQRTSGGYADLGPGQKATLPVTSRAPAPGETRSRGWLVLSWQNRSGESQSLLLPAGR